MQRRRIGLAVAAVAVVGAAVAGGAALAAGSDGDDQPGRSGQPGQSGQRGPGGYGGPGLGARPFGDYLGEGSGDTLEDHRYDRRPGGDESTVGGEELAEVTAAVEAELPDVTVTSVRTGADGSYLVLGTRDGEPVFVAVSADLSTVAERERPEGLPEGPESGPLGDAGPRPEDGPLAEGGPRGELTEVTGDELAEVTAAVEAELPAVVVVDVHHHDGDRGGYHVLGTRGDEPVLIDVSEDLTTVTEVERPTGPPDGGPMGRPDARPGGPDAWPGGPFGGPADENGEQPATPSRHQA